MRRRRLLAAVAAGALSGCAWPFGGRRTPTLTPADVPPAERTPTPVSTVIGTPTGPQVSLVDLETVPRTLALRGRTPETRGVHLGAEFVDTATADGPATVAVTFTNRAGSPRQFSFETTPPLSSYRGPSATDEAALVLVPAPDHPRASGVEYEPERAPDGCWRPSRPPSVPRMYWFVTLAPGESIRGTYHLLNAPGNDECLPPGRYTFGTRYGGRLVFDVWNTTAPGPSDGSALEGREVPDLPAGPTAWYHEADRRTRVYLEPGRERLALPRAAVELALHNRSRTTLTGGASCWRLSKLHDGAWAVIEPRSPPPGAAFEVPPGGTHEWTLRLRAGPADAAGAGPGPTAGYLGGGTYAFGVDASPGNEVYAALLALRGPPVELAPTEHVRDVTREDDVVSVLSSRYDTTIDQQTVLFARRIVLRHPGDLPELLAEQVMRSDGLRNTLPFFEEDVRTVRLRTNRTIARRVVGPGDGARRIRFRFRGGAFEVGTEPADATEAGAAGTDAG